jgi:hypothetical protein
MRRHVVRRSVVRAVATVQILERSVEGLPTPSDVLEEERSKVQA